MNTSAARTAMMNLGVPKLQKFKVPFPKDVVNAIPSSPAFDGVGTKNYEKAQARASPDSDTGSAKVGKQGCHSAKKLKTQPGQPKQNSVVKR
eukprot:CAMPEP_0170501236 /NCGR_PEP_ID=MMETSP0208-20121228/37649_1 /TAXON_ID=197538 /ORGANISM="Strombidium inclinatum, Strain S3" /LENGTH=91 /DNA_ID=CAMNT_0010779671 /DNA_START=13 /DNA_END=285 /DNA_ORIENTATION=-